MMVYFIKPINQISLQHKSAKTGSYLMQFNYRGDMLLPLPSSLTIKVLSYHIYDNLLVKSKIPPTLKGRVLYKIMNTR